MGTKGELTKEIERDCKTWASQLRGVMFGLYAGEKDNDAVKVTTAKFKSARLAPVILTHSLTWGRLGFSYQIVELNEIFNSFKTG